MLLLLLLIALQAPAEIPAAGPATDDDELFSDLGQELLEESVASPPVTPPAAADDDLQGEAGEDLGQPSSTDPYGRISDHMRTAGRLLEQKDASGRASATQKEVLDDLDRLIDQLRQQQQRRQPQPSPTRPTPQQSVRSQPSEPEPQPGQPEQARQREAGEATQPTESAATDSSERLGQREVGPVDVAGMEGLFKELWGHLPRRDRERMVESPFDRFLPKYEWEIERYFRRLAEDPDLSEQPAELPPAR